MGTEGLKSIFRSTVENINDLTFQFALSNRWRSESSDLNDQRDRLPTKTLIKGDEKKYGNGSELILTFHEKILRIIIMLALECINHFLGYFDLMQK